MKSTLVITSFRTNFSVLLLGYYNKFTCTAKSRVNYNILNVSRFIIIITFRLHLMLEVRTIAINNPGICFSVSLSWFSCAKTAKRNEVLFGAKTLGGTRNIVLNGGPDSPTARGKRGDAAFAKLLYIFTEFSRENSIEG